MRIFSHPCRLPAFLLIPLAPRGVAAATLRELLQSGCGSAAQGAERAIIAAMSGVRLFVYGSLKRAGRHHHLLKDAVFLGEVETAAGYALESAGPYLELVVEAGAGKVSGELFEISASLLPALDDFEGDAYMRAEVSLNAAPEVGPLAAGKLGLGRGHGQTALAYFKKAR